MLDQQKATNPKFYRRVFQFIKEAITCLQEFPTRPCDVYWPMYIETVKQYVEVMANIKDVTLHDMLENESLMMTYLLPAVKRISYVNAFLFHF